MSDFYQTGVVATLHRLVKSGHERLEQELSTYAARRPIALVLPALWSEFEGPALPRILNEQRQLAGAPKARPPGDHPPWSRWLGPAWRVS